LLFAALRHKRNFIAKALDQYEGAMILVSHVPVVGTVTGCLIGSGIAGVSITFDQVTGTNTNKIIFTDLANLREGGRFACQGDFAY